MNVYFAKVKTTTGVSMMRVKAENETQARENAIKQSLDKSGVVDELRFLYAL